MKKLFLWLMPILLIIGSTNEANARSKKKKGKANLVVEQDPVSVAVRQLHAVLEPGDLRSWGSADLHFHTQHVLLGAADVGEGNLENLVCVSPISGFPTISYDI